MIIQSVCACWRSLTFLSQWSTLAPCSSSTLTVAAEPNRHAVIRGVCSTWVKVITMLAILVPVLLLLSLVPRLSPSSLFLYVRFYLCEISVQREGRGRAWEALITCGHWWRVQCPLCPRMRVQKNEKEAQISVLVGFLECSTDGSIDGQDCQPTFWCLALLNLIQCQWVGCHDPMMIVLRDSRARGGRRLAGSLVHRSSHL